MSQKYDVFVSYSSRDRAMAEELANRLREAGLSLFFDRWCLPGGKPWGPLLEQSIQESASCTVLIGKEGFGSWQAREMWVALGRQGRDPAFPVIPTMLPGAEEVPSLFLGLNTWVDLRRGVDDEAAFQMLLQAIRGEAMGGPLFEELAEAVRPYLGLRAFREEDAAFFFGREAFTERLVEAVERTPFLAVVGPSGSGKSSVGQAGLIPALRKGVLEGSKAWEFAVFRPYKNPLWQLAAPLVFLLEPEMDEVTRLAKVGELADYLREGRVGLADAAGRILEKRHYVAQAAGAERLVLVADQFEELFTYKESEPEREIFLGHLLAAAEERDGALTVILTLRADFYSHCLGVRPLADRLEGRVVNIGPMTEEELRRAIEEPARKVGVGFETGLVERILEDVRGEPGALPLLEFALTELWERRRGGLLPHEAYEEFGGVDGAIAQRAERECERFSEEEKKLTRRIFLNLVTPGEETEDIRRRAALAEMLPEEPAHADSVRAVVKALADARLITTGREEASGEETVEVAHEALIRGWERLKGWVQEDRAFLEWLKGLRVDLARWKESGELLRGRPLAEARDWLEKRGEDLSAEARRFIQASARRERQRRALTFTAVAVAFALICFAALFAWQQRGQVIIERDNVKTAQAKEVKQRETAEAAEAHAVTREAEAVTARKTAEAESRISISRELAAAAIGQLEVDPELSLLLAVEAVETAYTEQAEDALRQALASPWRTTLRGHTGPIYSAAYSPDGRWIVTASRDGTARVWDAQSGQEMMELEHTDWLASAVYSPDGRWIVTASRDGTARVWEAASGQQKMELQGHTGSVLSVAYSPDGRRIVTAGGDRTTRVWEAASGQQKMELQGHTDAVISAAYSPDGQWIVTASYDRTARVWNAQSGQQKIELQGHTRFVRSAAYSPDGQWIVTASGDGTARVWDAESGQQMMVLQHTVWIYSAAYSPDGRWIVTASGDGTARVWDAESGQQMMELPAHTDQVYSAAYSPDGRWIVTASTDGTARVWEAEGGNRKRVLQGHTNLVKSVAYSPDGRWVVTASGDRTARVWDAESGQQKIELRGHTDYVNSAAYSPDGRWIVTASADGTARVWDAGSGQQKMVLPHTGVNSAAYSPDGRWIVTAGDDGTARVWDAESGQQKMELKGHTDQVYSAAYSPDGRWIVTAGYDKTARVWEAESGQQVMELQHTDPVYSAAYSPDGRWIVTASWDRMARVWEAESGLQKLELQHPDRVNSAAYSPDGRWIVTAGGDGTARVWWGGNVEGLLAEARSRLARELTCQERVQYLHEDLDCGAGE